MSWQLLTPVVIEKLVDLGLAYFNTPAESEAPKEVAKKTIKVTVMASLEVEATSIEEAQKKLNTVAEPAGVTILEVQEE